MNIRLFFLLLGMGLFMLSCSNSTQKPLTQLQSIRAKLIGDWEEDSMAFKKEYKMPPPPAQNSKVRWQDDGYVYIPGVLITKENWDRWELINDTTIHVKKRQTGDTRVFIIDNISENVLNYRMIVSPKFHRKFRLLKINNDK